MGILHTIHRISLLIIWSASSCAPMPEASTPAKDVELVAAQFNKWEEGESNLFELLADDVEWTVSGSSPVSGTYYSKAAFMQKAVQPITERLATPLQPTLISLTYDSTYIWLQFRASAHTATGSSYENQYLWKMQVQHQKIVSCTAFLDTYALEELLNPMEKNEQTIEETRGYIGMWVTADGYIRHELLPNHRYDEARGDRRSAYQGSYKVAGNRIDYRDDTGFTADGEFKEGILYHAGMVLYKEKK